MDSQRRNRISQVGIVVVAALMVEAISIVQYQRLRSIMQEESSIRGSIVVGAIAHDVQHTLDLVETTMQENLWDVKHSMAHPDSVFPAMIRLIDDNPHVVGGCLAFSPYYYPSKGRLFEPYATKETDGTVTVKQIAGPDHDYTQNDEYQWVIDHRTTSWTDPYFFGPDSLSYTTYSYPILDSQGKIVAICGLDVDLSWLGDILNARQPFPSSFGLLLTQEGDFVAGPPTSRALPAEVQQAMAIINASGDTPLSAHSSLAFVKTSLDKDPFWQLVQVYKTDELYAKMRRMRTQQVFLILLALAILAFMIERYSRNEKKLRAASEEQARITSELSVARRIQEEMLPKTFPAMVFGSLEPAREVGGDLYDFFQRDGKFFFCIGDVAGKGVPAAMLMSVAHSLFHQVSRRMESPSGILRALNQQFCEGNDSNMFMTFFVACLDLYSGELTYATAGHDRPFVLTDQISLLPAKSNLPLGSFADVHFEEHTCTLAPGTTLLLYTDGLTEAKNVQRQEFGRKGISAVLERYLAGKDQRLETLVKSLSEAAHAFAGDAPQSDDLTLLAVRFSPEYIVRDQITLMNETAEVNRLSEFVKAFFDKLGVDKRTASAMRLALEEAVVNVINYAYPDDQGEVLVQADSNGHEVRFTIKDSGFPFDPTSVLDPDTTLDAQNRPIGGLGILLSRKLMDSVSYNRKDGKNVLSLTKTLL